MRTIFRVTLVTLLWVPGLVMCPASLQAAPKQPLSDPPVSVERIRERLERPPSRPLTPVVPEQLRVTFKTRVDQRVFVPTLEEHLHKEFDLNPLQRQSADWASRCCGYNVAALLNHVEKALRDRKVRKTREQIRRELAELEEAREKGPAIDLK